MGWKRGELSNFGDPEVEWISLKKAENKGHEVFMQNSPVWGYMGKVA